MSSAPLVVKITALDLSLSSTGWARTPVAPQGSPAPSPRPRCGVVSPPSSVGKGVVRLAWLRDAVLDRVDGTDLVVIEGYSFHSRGRGTIARAELGGVFRLALHDRGIPWVEVSPSSLKRYATGKGNAPKEAVLASAIRRLGYPGHLDDEADALWLLAMAQDHYGLPGAPAMPKSHRKALEGVRWLSPETLS